MVPLLRGADGRPAAHDRRRGAPPQGPLRPHARAPSLRARLLLAAVLAGLAAAAPAQARPQVGVASARYAAAGDASRLTSVGARWTYDWSDRSGLGPGGRVEFVPMLWGAASVTDEAVARLRAARDAGRARWLLGFNEPDLAGQADLAPARAAALWPRLEATGLRLVSPAVASTASRSPDDPSRTWLDDFLRRVRAQGGRVDAIALHYYGDYTDPATARWIVRDLRAVHARYGLPIWVTELGALDAWRWEGRAPHAAPTPARARAHLRRMAAALDRLPFVTRWAWSMDRCDGSCARSSALFGAGGRRTALGAALARVAARG